MFLITEWQLFSILVYYEFFDEMAIKNFAVIMWLS